MCDKIQGGLCSTKKAEALGPSHHGCGFVVWQIAAVIALQVSHPDDSGLAFMPSSPLKLPGKAQTAKSNKHFLVLI